MNHDSLDRDYPLGPGKIIAEFDIVNYHSNRIISLNIYDSIHGARNTVPFMLTIEESKSLISVLQEYIKFIELETGEKDE